MTDFTDNPNIIITRKPIKHVYFRINMLGQLCISAPKNIENKKLNKIISQKSDWIKKQQQKTQQHLAANSDHQFRLWGKSYQIHHLASPSKKISLVEGMCHYQSPENWDRAQKNKGLIEYQRLELMQKITQYIEYYQPIIGVSVKEVRSKKMTTRWGSCNIAKQRLWFSVYLAKYPQKCCEYVVVHEMTHLLERYHNKRFYQLVEQAMPDWKTWHNYLRNPAY